MVGLPEHGMKTQIEEELGSRRTFVTREMRFVEVCRRLTNFDTAGVDINVGDVQAGGRVT
jgi:hypothetical protein